MGQAVSGKIFISYRRDDSAPYALSIAQYLENVFGKGNVFVDVDRLRPGEHFPEILSDRLRDSAVMLVVIGPLWLASDPITGRRRIDDNDDWVQLEIATALARNVHVVPLLVGGAQFPVRDDLPTQLRPLADRHYSALTTSGFRYEMAGLANDIKAFVGGPAAKPAVASKQIMRMAVRLSLVAAVLGTGYGYVDSHMKANEQAKSTLRLNEGWNCANKYSDEQLKALGVTWDGKIDISKIGCSSTSFIAYLSEIRDLSNRRDASKEYWLWFDKWSGAMIGAFAFVAVNALGLLAVALMRLANWVAR